jgi:hypothetical protein
MLRQLGEREHWGADRLHLRLYSRSFVDKETAAQRACLLEDDRTTDIIIEQPEPLRATAGVGTKPPE